MRTDRADLSGDEDPVELAGVVSGEEAHIIARSIDGPRGRYGNRSAFDAYTNTVLLCSRDHKRIDRQ